MSSLNALHEIDLVAQHLPFHLNDTDKVNAAFRRWRHHDDDDAKYYVDIWKYCFIRRYFVVKFIHEVTYSNAADMDALIEQAYIRVQNKEETVSDSKRYASWVSVVCKNVFRNYLRGNQIVVSIDQEGGGSQWEGDSIEAIYDAGMVSQAIHQAIARLPDFLREIAFLRFIVGYSYQEIEKCTGKPLSTVRAYIYKAVHRLKSDPAIRPFLDKPK